MTKEIGRKTAALTPKIAKPRSTRAEQLIRLLKRKTGASAVQIQDAFGWQPHTARVAISGLRKAGHLVERNTSTKGAVYRILPKPVETADAN